MSVTAIVPAAGRGARMKGDIPKQFLLLAGKPILIHTLNKLSRCKVDEMVIVVQEEKMDLARRLIEEELADKPFKLVKGGVERQDSVRAGLAAVDKDCSIVVVHDAVRPFVNPGAVNEVIEAAEKTGAAILAVRPSDTIRLEDKDSGIMDDLPRDRLWQIQTPQAFSKDLLIAGHKKALGEGYSATDDAGLVEHMGHRVTVVQGDSMNLKITGPRDLELAQVLLKQAQ